MTLAILDAGLSRPAPCRIVFCGSSTTAGVGASTKANRYVDRLVAKLQRAYGGTAVVSDSDSAEFGTVSTDPGVHGYNAGQSGTTAAGYITTTEAGRIADLDPVMVVHAIGGNDYYQGVSVATFRANVEAAIQAINAGLTVPCLHVLLLQQERRDSGGSPVAAWADYGMALRHIAETDPARIVHVDASAPFTELDCFGADPYGLGHTDDVHLTDTGHGLLAATVWRALGRVEVPEPPQPVEANFQWSTWVPQWTNVTLGGATVVGRYRKVGGTFDYRLRLIVASDTVFTGQPVFSLPVTLPGSIGTSDVFGWGACSDVSGPDHAAVARPVSSTTLAVSYVAGGSLAAVSASAPFTWAAGDELVLNGAGIECI